MPGTHKLPELLVITSNHLNYSGCLLPKLAKLHGVFKSPAGSQTTRGASDSRFASVYGEWNRIAFGPRNLTEVSPWACARRSHLVLKVFYYNINLLAQSLPQPLELLWTTSCQRDFSGVLPEAPRRLSAAEPAEVPASARGLADHSWNFVVELVVCALLHANSRRGCPQRIWNQDNMVFLSNFLSNFLFGNL
ncbi:hypothetical protein BD779DRAFT_1632553 [Infundibulicybe gibba]|nr:hypothetical protein BD779DRAFT_1632553 [Infundibulicybe gibba]